MEHWWLSLKPLNQLDETQSNCCNYQMYLKLRGEGGGQGGREHSWNHKNWRVNYWMAVEVGKVAIVFPVENGAALFQRWLLLAMSSKQWEYADLATYRFKNKRPAKLFIPGEHSRLSTLIPWFRISIHVSQVLSSPIRAYGDDVQWNVWALLHSSLWQQDPCCFPIDT